MYEKAFINQKTRQNFIMDGFADWKFMEVHQPLFHLQC